MKIAWKLLRWNHKRLYYKAFCSYILDSGDSMKLEDLNVEYDKLQKKYGAKELSSSWYR